MTNARFELVDVAQSLHRAGAEHWSSGLHRPPEPGGPLRRGVSGTDQAAGAAGCARYLGAFATRGIDPALLDTAAGVGAFPIGGGVRSGGGRGAGTRPEIFRRAARRGGGHRRGRAGAELFDWMTGHGLTGGRCRLDHGRTTRLCQRRPCSCASVMHPEVIAQRHLEIYREVLK